MNAASLLVMGVALGALRPPAAEPWRQVDADGVGARGKPPATVAALPARAPEAGSGGPSLASAPGSWPQTIREVVASPVFSDLDGDGSQDVIVADDLLAYVFDSAGNLRPGWPRNIGGCSLHAAVADLDRDGLPEILFGSLTPTPRLWVFDAAGNPKLGWPVALPYSSLLNTSCPVVADLTGNGTSEVGIASERGVSFFDADGNSLPGWPYLWPVPVNNPQWSCPAVGDLDADGALEVVVGNVNYPDWGVHVIRADGTPMDGWPQVIKPVFSSPALADLDADEDLEIIVQEGDPGSQGFRMWVWNHDGTPLPGWPRVIAIEGQSSRCSPAVADIDGDGGLEIITVTGDGLLHIFQPSGVELLGWPRPTEAIQPISSPAVIDIDGDAVQEIFLTYWRDQQQYVSAWRLDGSVPDGFPKLLFSQTQLNSHCSAHVADADGDGVADLTVAGSDFSTGAVWVLTVDQSIYNPETRRDWPKIRRDAENQGCYCPEATTAVGAVATGIASSFAVMPNPVFASDPLRLQGPAGRRGLIAVIDASGRTVASRTIAFGGGQFVVPSGEILGNRKLASGVYFLRWQPTAGGGAETVPLVLLGP